MNFRKWWSVFLLAIPLAAQTLPDAAPFRSAQVQFFDANGAPLAGGKLYTCVAGLSCPGNPQATYTDSTASVQNANPVVLDSGGRAQIWLGSQAYRLVLQDANAVQQWTQDNVEDTTLYFVNFVKTAGTATLITYTAPLTGAVQRTVANRLADAISIKDFGVVCDGTTANSAALIESMFSSNPGLSLRIPGATCVLDNSAGPIVITGWSGGTIRGDSGAALSCNTLANRCLEFDSPSNVSFDRFKVTYGPAVVTRGGQNFGLYILSGTNVALSNMSFVNIPSAALVVQQSDNVQTSNITYDTNLGNGLLVTNSTHVATDNTYCNNVQDACEEFSGYDAFAGVPAGICQYVTVTNLISYNSFTGVLFNSCPDSTLNGFAVYNGYGAGVAVYQDSGTTTTKWPYRIAISNGVINTMGYIASTNYNAQGILVAAATAPPQPINVNISNVSIYNIARDGVQIGTDANGDHSNFNVELSNVTVDTTGNILGSPGTGGRCFTFSGTGSVTFSNLHARNCYSFGLYVSSETNLLVRGEGLYLYNIQNSSTGDPRALWEAGTKQVSVNNVTLVDDRNPATGYQLADAGSGPLNVTGITPVIAHGTYAALPGAVTSHYFLADLSNLFSQTPANSPVNIYSATTGPGHPGAQLTAGQPINGSGQYPEVEVGYANTGGSGATVSAVLTGGALTGTSSLVGGSGYEAGGTYIQIIGDGTGASAHPTVAGGIVTGIVIDTAGSGYGTMTMNIVAGGYGWIQAALAGKINTNTLVGWQGGRVILGGASSTDDGSTAVQIPNGGLRAAGYINGIQGYKYNGTLGYTGTKTAGSCTLTIQGGIITNVTGC